MQWVMRNPKSHYDRLYIFDVMTITEDDLIEVLKYLESFDHDILSEEKKDGTLIISWKGWIREVIYCHQRTPQLQFEQAIP